MAFEYTSRTPTSRSRRARTTRSRAAPEQGVHRLAGRQRPPGSCCVRSATPGGPSWWNGGGRWAAAALDLAPARGRFYLGPGPGAPVLVGHGDHRTGRAGWEPPLASVGPRRGSRLVVKEAPYRSSQAGPPLVGSCVEVMDGHGRPVSGGSSAWRRQRPVHCGARFSANALGPS